MTETFGEMIRAVRAKRGLTQAEAATTCGVSLRSWKRWEAGGRPRTREACMVSAAFELPLRRVLVARAITAAP